MNPYCCLAVGSMLSAAALAGAARGQGSPAAASPIIVPVPQFGGSAGISIPVGGLGKTHSAGFNLGAVFAYRLPTEALGIRGELQYQRFERKPNVAPLNVPEPTNVNSLALLLDALYHVPGYAFRPYVIGGMGFYHVYDANRPGFNAGVGIDIPLTGLSAYFEARLHKALTDGPTSYVTLPISFGLTF